MSSPNRGCRAPDPEDLIKVGLGVVLPMSIAIGGASGFMPFFQAVVLVVFFSGAFAAAGFPLWLGWRLYQRRRRRAVSDVCTPGLSVREIAGRLASAPLSTGKAPALPDFDPLLAGPE